MIKRFLVAAAGLMLTLSSVVASSATWLPNPDSGDWNIAANWTIGGPPNGPADIATFQASSISSLMLSAHVEVVGVIFAAGANPYTITANPAFTLTLSALGIVNNSQVTQNFVVAGNNGRIGFTGGSSAGLNTAFTITGAAVRQQPSGLMEFRDSSSAGYGTFSINGGTASYADGGVMRFFDSASGGNGSFTINAGNGGADGNATAALLEFLNQSSAGQGVFVTMGGTSSEGGGVIRFRDSSTADAGSFTTNGCAPDGGGSSGATVFRDNSTAGNATFITNGGGYAGVGGGGYVAFSGNASAANGHFTTNGATQFLGGGGSVVFYEDSSAGNGVFISNGSAFSNLCPPGYICGDRPPAAGGTAFLDTATAADSTLIANGGTNGGDGGLIGFYFRSTGGTARIKVFGNGALSVSNHSIPGATDNSVTIGSIEGDGLVFLGGVPFSGPLIVGSNNLSTNFSGVMSDGNPGGGGGINGSLTKIGTGTLTLSAANTYTGATTVNGGRLEVDGSIMSAATVNSGGALGGSGVTRNVTVNSGGKVAPGGAQTLRINGNYAQNAGGVLKIDVVGTDPDASSRLDVTGNATLDGTLEVRFQDGLLPLGGQIIKIFSVTGALSGSFAQIIFPDLRAGFQFQPEFVSGTYQIKALSDGVPATGFRNISTRLRVGTGDNALIGGVIITPSTGSGQAGSASKKVIVRAIGPSLASLPGRLADPTVELRDSAGGLLFSNDNWTESPQAQQIIDSGIAPGHDHEAAIVATLAPGSYTAIMRGAGNSTGIGVVEVYDLAQEVPATLANISSRGLVETGDNVMIGGFIADNQAMHVMVRAIGPSLTEFGIPNALADPTLTLHNAQGAILAFNNDWRDDAEATIQGSGLPPANDKESAILATLAPGNYTAIVRGLNDTTGVGLVEVYHLQ